MEKHVYEDFRIHLMNELAQRSQNNASYSLRSFAQSVGVPHTSLSLILNRKRKLTKKMLLRLATGLDLSSEEITHFIDDSDILINKSDSPAKNTEELYDNPRGDSKYSRLEMDVFFIISDWYCFALVELLSLEGGQSHSQWLAKQLGLTASQVNIALERLERVEMIEKDKMGVYRPLGPSMTMVSHFKSTSLARKKLQEQYLKKSIEKLKTVDIKDRHHSGTVMAIDKTKINLAKEKIKQFHQEMHELLDEGNGNDSVYLLNVGLIPLTSVTKK